MRALLLVASLLLAGCTTGPSTRDSCGPATAPLADGQRVHVLFLNNGDLDRRLCATLNDAGPYDVIVKRSNAQPNVGEFANVTIPGDVLRVKAWVAGTSPRSMAEESLDGERWVVLTTARDGLVRVQVFTEEPMFL